MDTKNMKSVLLSIFKRKGGEGEFTKIINANSNEQKNADDILNMLDGNEAPIILYSNDSGTKVLLTDRSIIMISYDKKHVIPYSTIAEVSPAFQEEFRSQTSDMSNFTRIKVKDKNNNTYILMVERGLPYQGIFQMLHFCIS